MPSQSHCFTLGRFRLLGVQQDVPELQLQQWRDRNKMPAADPVKVCTVTTVCSEITDTLSF